ncbi:sulfite reductase subunit alpha [Roseibium aggregatum]|uniref:Sulfite reductase [NADPH] flavoprotein alpha-component n=1 Tax=Roseibium aggregatum TaxID=187304 RepID=A0A939EHB0_9HYPH|nr:sulfite reductase subunit alpha [Roseibium aggregatum]MBN9671740.1 sulfite reductase subunit alpha [Roseibium aggregatum]
MQIPFIPEDAPFNEDQRSWLSGFLAGLHSRLSLQGQPAASAAPGAAGQKEAPVVNILFGTQTGNAETVAMDAAGVAKSKGLAPVVQALDDVALDALKGMSHVLVVISTYGEGEMPDNAQLFWDALSAQTAPRLESLAFGVLALGNTGYDDFCQAGKLIDMRLEQLGARRLLPRADCDVDFEDDASGWMEDALPRIASERKADPASVPAETAGTLQPAKQKWSRKAPYSSSLALNRLLSGEGSSKEIRHFEFSLGDSGISYSAGDALGVMPVNDPKLVEAILEVLGSGYGDSVDGVEGAFGDALKHRLEIATPSKDLIAEIERRAGDEELSHIVKNGDKEALESWLWGRDILDLLSMLPAQSLSAAEFAALLKPLQHRAYSISSSPLEAPERIHLTVASVRYRAFGREHGGVCSTFLADRIEHGGNAGIFLSPNNSFRLPEDTDRPVIMVGPGTGIAPFRAFLQERRASGAKGLNWLFFGDQHKAHDFIYEEELTEFTEQGVLNRLDLAFSRDQDQKIYVQHRMKENGKDLFAWLEDGACFYVCGDATRMARDVDQALHDVVATFGSLSPEAAEAYVANLKREKRYLRDVY